MKHFNRLSPAEAERLALLGEEMGEAQQAIGKILRHGYESRHPGGGPTNRESLEEELGHVRFSIYMMGKAHDVSFTSMLAHKANKAESVKKYLHHQTQEKEASSVPPKEW